VGQGIRFMSSVQRRKGGTEASSCTLSLMPLVSTTTRRCLDSFLMLPLRLWGKLHQFGPKGEGEEHSASGDVPETETR
jgi:hypothetical protein